METFPNQQDIQTLAKEIEKPCIIPITRSSSEFKNPSIVYQSIRQDHEYSFLLESLEGPSWESRYSIIGYDPLLHIKILKNQTTINGLPEAVEASQKRFEKMEEDTDELEIVRKIMFLDEMRTMSFDLPQDMVGITGYLSYDYVRPHSGMEPDSEDDLDHPTLEFMLPSSVIIFDHFKEQVLHASFVLLIDDLSFENSISQSLDELEERFEPYGHKDGGDLENISLESNFEKEEFEKSVQKVKKYIKSGDVIQTVISQRIKLKPSPDLERFYSKLREINPSPYMFFLDFSETKLIGSSPEALVRVQDEKVLTRPIAGTRKRGKDVEDDLAMERDLLRDEKERAEHIMLVDLGRNDVGKISKYGTVSVPEFMEVEKYGDVQHIVSTVTGELEDGVDSIDALRAVFPAGTVTGAPKVRAMEIIEELEPTRRGIYSGAVGTFSYNGNANFGITIRTLTEQNGEAHIQVGAGIVADSVPEKEYYETKDKAKSLLRAAGVMNEDCSD